MYQDRRCRLSLRMSMLSSEPSSVLAGRAVAAYGGAARWRAANTVDAHFDCGGLLFGWKRRTLRFPDLHIRCAVREPLVRIEPIDARGHAAILEGHDVRLERPGGSTVDLRRDAGRRFPYGRRLLSWDQLDLAYFLTQAMWNYLVLPGLLLREDIEWRQLSGSTLEGRFPAHLPTHCAVQQYRFDPLSGLLEQYDYTAEAFGRWAKAAHLVTEHRTAGGLAYTARRRVKPRGPGGAPLPGPLLIWADIHRFALLPPSPDRDESP